MCDFKELEYENRTPQTVQTYGRSPVCTLKCTWRFPDVLKPLSQILQRHGISSLCSARTWRLSVRLVLKLFAQSEQENGLSALCLIECRWRSHARRNTIRQLSQRWGLRPVWTLMWRCTPTACLKRRPQTAQMCGMSSEWVRSWNERVLCCVKRLVQPGTRHVRGRSPVCVITCVLSVVEVLNTRPHWLHTYCAGFFGAGSKFCRSHDDMWCVTLCLRSANRSSNGLLHVEQRTKRCSLPCLTKFFRPVNWRPHVEWKVFSGIISCGGWQTSAFSHIIRSRLNSCFRRPVNCVEFITEHEDEIFPTIRTLWCRFAYGVETSCCFATQSRFLFMEWCWSWCWWVPGWQNLKSVSVDKPLKTVLPNSS